MNQNSVNANVYGWKFLIIDDSVEEAELTTRMLAEVFNGAKFQVVDNPKLALSYLDEHHFHLVILDYHMPQIDGLQLLASIVRQPGVPPILMLTGRGDEDVAVSAIKRGADDYVVKKNRGEHRRTLQHRVNQLLLGAIRQDQRPSHASFCEGVIGVDGKGKICFVNNSAAERLEVGRLDMVGRALSEYVRVIPNGAEQEVLGKLCGDLFLRRVKTETRSEFFARGERISDLSWNGVREMADGLSTRLNPDFVVVPHALYAKVCTVDGVLVTVEVRLVEAH